MQMNKFRLATVYEKAVMAVPCKAQLTSAPSISAMDSQISSSSPPGTRLWAPLPGATHSHCVGPMRREN